LQNTWSFCNNTSRQINNVLQKEKKESWPLGKKKKKKSGAVVTPPQTKKQALEEGIDHRLIWNM
jgi:hypothetical protein